MFRWNWNELKPVAFIKNLLGKEKPRKKVTTEAVWQLDLENLSSRYGDAMQPTTYEVVGDGVLQESKDQLKELLDEVKGELDEMDRIVVRKERKQVTTTSVDLKAWWGQSVATWDPIDGKNVDSIDQQRRPRKAKWFDG
jgi:hypothetical protein